MNDVLDYGFAHLLLADIRLVLGADQHGADPQRAAVTVFHGHLGLAVRA